ncbi:glycine betaine/proline transport system substrate-binding protein [Onishia taeanensis]|uniref:Glycine betaine/proline transport system substrate-binding protein n=2 Tax=Oceanospirillales TaxID=135619 RepID=A0A328XTD8_9GAMM|nr:glycine betaine/proline transport system substrate-binding protein [Halomonas taeanensis]
MKMFRLTAISLTLLAGLSLAGQALAAAGDRDDTLRIVVPPWPGVTVKSEMLSQLIEPLGYTADKQELSSTVAYQTLGTNESDVFLAGWMPSQTTIYDAAMAKGTIVDLGSNISGARMGFAVPGYVYEAGITSAEQLADPEVAERFGYTVYSIESGSNVTDMLNSAIEANTYGLGNWEGMSSSTPGMLSEVDAAARDERWIVFYGWTPHWMVPEYDSRILDDPESVYGANNGRNDVKTIVSKAYSDANPNMRQLLDQFTFSADDQSDFIREYSLKERKLETVAHDWLVAHPEKVAEFLEGVTTRDGKPALPAVEASL